MALVEVTLNSYRYHFRRLTWQEEARLQFSKTETTEDDHGPRPYRRARLAVTTEQGLTILKKIPDAVFWRIWVVYRGNLREDRYYTSGGLYKAPDQMTHRQRIFDDGVAVEVAAEPRPLNSNVSSRDVVTKPSH